MRDIGKNIKSLRIQQNMTQDELAEKLFVTRQTVSNYETGRSRPDVEMLAKIAEVLNTDANMLIYGLPKDTDRKKQYLKAAVSGTLLLVLLLPLPWLNTLTAHIRGYLFIIWPRYLLEMYYLPLILLFSGWFAMQLLSLFTKLTPLPRAKTKWLFRGCQLFLLLYILMALLMILPFTKPRWLLYTLYFMLGVWPEGIAINWAYLLFPAGALLWLCGIPGTRK